MRADLLLWTFPALTLLIGMSIRLLFGEELTAGVIVGAPVTGLVLSACGFFWGRVKRRELVRGLASSSRKLEESRVHLEKVVESSPEAILISDLRGKINFASRSAGTLLGTPFEELLGQPVERFFKDGIEAARRIRRLLEEHDGHLSGRPTTALRADGVEVPVGLSASMIRRADGKPHEILAVLHDLTDKLQAEEQALATERLRVLGESVAGIAHELNNPLTGVIGYLQLAAREDDSEKQAGILHKAGIEADRMARTIRTLLGFVRQRSPEHVPTDLAELSREIQEFQGYQLRVNNIVLLVEAGDLPLAMLDGHQIQQVLLNLVKNSEDAIRESGVGGRITIRVSRSRGEFHVEVSDDGPGIPDENLGRAFDHFFTTKPSGKGTGLGLSICRQIVEAHGGSIELVQSEGRGAHFRIRLPVPVASRPEPEAPPAPFEPGPIRILVVDDEDSVRDYVVSVLSLEGHEIEEAGSGTQAVELLCDRSVDLAFVDMKMPDMDGELCAREMIAVRPELAGRIVHMSGDSITPAEDCDFLMKPMSPDEILDIVARVVGREGVTS